MAASVTGLFETRRQAEMTIERLVQEYGVDRAAITVTAAGDANTVGVERAGSDDPGPLAAEEGRDDAPLAGAVRLDVALTDGTSAETVRRAFAEFSADPIDDPDTRNAA